jgi:hypothetical protein
MTYPFGAYVCVVDIGVTEIRRFYVLDDCGTRINPMIIEGAGTWWAGPRRLPSRWGRKWTTTSTAI